MSSRPYKDGTQKEETTENEFSELSDNKNSDLIRFRVLKFLITHLGSKEGTKQSNTRR